MVNKIEQRKERLSNNSNIASLAQTIYFKNEDRKNIWLPQSVGCNSNQQKLFQTLKWSSVQFFGYLSFS